MERTAWSLRRLHVPVDDDALVLDVGSGGNPYPRANVLLDAYEDTIERFHAPLVKDRPMVFGLMERLPFKDKAFDFIIASHVLEHTPDPAAFLGEMMRVGKAGYIETPDAFFERINPFRFHRLEVGDVEGSLVIFKKPSWRHATELVDMYEHKLKDPEFIRFARHPWPFYVRFYWENKIPYRIQNPQTDAAWALPKEQGDESIATSSFRRRIRGALVKCARLAFSQNLRNRRVDLLRLLRCPGCGSESLMRDLETLRCSGCSAGYPVMKGIPIMYPTAGKTTAAA
jgi:SAM-dependent methyltransferase